MAFDDVAQGVVDDTFAEFGIPATRNAGPTPITIIVDLRDAGARPDDGRPLAGQITIEVRKTEVAAPVKGDTFTFNNRMVTVANRPQLSDESGLVWTMWAE